MAKAKHPKQQTPPVESLRLEWRSPEELADNPKNWRTHPESQANAVKDVITEVGWAGAVLFNERTGRLIDGHLRRKLAAEQGVEKIPVLIGSWDKATEAKILATLDPPVALAEADATALDELLREIDTSSESVEQLLKDLAELHGVIPEDDKPTELKQLNVQAPPKMAWCLIGIPTVRYGEIAADMERIGVIDGVIMETTANDG